MYEKSTAQEITELMVQLGNYQGFGVKCRDGDGTFDYPKSMIKGRVNHIEQQLWSIRDQLKSLIAQKDQYEKDGYFYEKEVRKSGARVYCVRGGWTCNPYSKEKRIFKTCKEAYESENW